MDTNTLRMPVRTIGAVGMKGGIHLKCGQIVENEIVQRCPENNTQQKHVKIESTQETQA